MVSDIGLYDLRNRFYFPDLGRFLQPDPIGFNGDPTNLYRYCSNNPLMWRDPSGLNEDPPAEVERVIVSASPLLPDWFFNPDYSSPGPNFLGNQASSNLIPYNWMFGGYTGLGLGGFGSGRGGTPLRLPENNEVGVQNSTPSNVPSQNASVFLNWKTGQIVPYSSLTEEINKELLIASVFAGIFVPAALVEDEAGAEITTGFRAVSQAEFEAISESGAFESQLGGVEGKYFSDTLEQAVSFGERQYGGGNFGVVQAQFPTSAVGARINPITEGPGFFVPNVNLSSGTPIGPFPPAAEK